MARKPAARTIFSYTFAGMAFGCLFPLGAWALDIAIHPMAWSLATIWQLHRSNPLHWLIDSAPLILGLFAYQIGKREQAAAALRAALEQRVQERTAELARANDVLRQHNEYLTALHDTTLALMNRLELEELLQTIVARAAHLMDTPHGYLYLIESGETEMEARVGIGLFSRYLGVRLKPGEGLAGKIWQSGQPLVVKDYDDWAGRSPQFAESATRAAIGVPLTSAGQVVGVIGMALTEVDRSFGEAEIALLNGFAQLASLALDSARLYRAVQQQLDERKRTEATLRESERRYRSVFEDSPISLWEEDFSGVKAYLDRLHGDGVGDFREYFENHPEAVAQGAALVKIVDINTATLTLYRAGSKVELLGNLSRIFTPESYETFREELIAIAEGKTVFASEGINRTLPGEVLHTSLRWSVVPGYEATLTRVIVSLIDITERKLADAEVERSLSLLQATLESTTDGILVADGQGKIVSLNRKFVEMWGIPEAIVAARDDDQALAFVLSQLKEPDAFLSKVRELYAQPDAESYDILDFNDGRVFERYSQPQRIGGKSVGRVWSFHDVSELKRTEAELRALFAAMEDVVIVYDANGRYLQIAPTNPASLYRPAPEMLGKTVYEVLPAPQAELLHKHIQGALTERQTIRAEYSLLIRGTEVWRDATVSPLSENTVLWVGRDVTKRKQAEVELAQERNLLRTLIDNVPDFIYTKDIASRFRLANRAAATSLGLTPEAVVGKTDFDLHPPELAAQYFADEQAVLQSDQPLIDHEELVIIGGQERWMLTTTVPLHDGTGRVIGLVGIARDITERQQAAQALQAVNEKLTRSLAELEARTRQIALLNEMGDLLQACLTVEEAYTVSGRLVRQLFPDEAGALYVTSASRNLVEAVARWGAAPPETQVFAPDECWALRRGRLYLVEDVSTPNSAHLHESALLCSHLQPPWPAACLCIPLVAQGEASGVLHLQYLGADGALREAAHRHFDETKQQLARTVADSIALALANLNLRETLRNQSIRDPLTSLFNRRYMEESLEREIRRVARAKRPLGIIMLDIDHFKRFNDTFGHDAGDTLLRELGVFLQAHVRGEDIACRYGGEEFTLILPEASLEITRQRAEHLHKDINHLHVQHEGRPLGLVTLSLGVAAFPEHGAAREAVLRAADAALYRAKREGRNRVMIARSEATA